MSKKSMAPAAADNVVELRPQRAATKRKSEAKWGAEVMDLGFCILPSLLFRASAASCSHPTSRYRAVAEFWWEDTKFPWPSKDTLAERMGMSTKQIQRIAKQLEQRGYLKRIRQESRTSARLQTGTTCLGWCRS